MTAIAIQAKKDMVFPVPDSEHNGVFPCYSSL